MCAGGGPGSDAGLLDEFLREVINITNDNDSDDNHDNDSGDGLEEASL